MKKIIQWSTLALSLPALSCGGEGGALAPLNGPAGALESNQIASVLAQFENALATFSIDGNINPPQISGVHYGQTPIPLQENDYFADCRSENPDLPDDEDSDSIAKFKEIKFNCRSIDDGVAYRSQEGSIVIQDLDDTTSGGPGGYSFEYDLTGKSQYKDGGYYDYSYQGHFKYQIQSGSFIYDANLVTTNEGDSPSDGEFSYLYQQTWKHKVTPVDMEDPGLAGSVVMNGYFRMVNRSDDSSLTPIDVTLTTSSSGLVYDRSCNYFYQAGSLTLKDSQGNTIAFQYDCDNLNRSFNGQSI
ncbi:MAG: hypothetical protein ACOH5I_16545 [Oligoflexus sp.]